MRQISTTPPPTLSRRDFIARASFAALAAGLGRPSTFASVPGKPPVRMTVGAMPWVYTGTVPKGDITPALPQIFADFEYAGIGHIELLHNVLLSPETLARVGELSAKHGVKVLGSEFGDRMYNRELHGKILERAEQVILGLEKLGGRTLGTSVGKYREKKTEDQLDAQAELLKKIIAFADKHGVVVNLHNHTYEVENDLYDLKGTLARVPGVKLGPDIGWLVRAKVDPIWFINTYRDRLVFLHLRDQTADGRWAEAMGEGIIDYAAVGRALREIGFAGDAVIELAFEKNFVTTRPLRESFKMSRDHVRRVLGC